jgi:hypothetical protein
MTLQRSKPTIDVVISSNEAGYLLEKGSILTAASKVAPDLDDFWDGPPQVDSSAKLHFTREQALLVRQQRPTTPACFDLLEILNEALA